MWVETLQEQLHKLWHPFGSLEEDKGKSNDRSHSNIIAHVTDSGVKKDPDRLVGSSAAIRECQGILGTITQDGVSIGAHFFNEGIGILLLTVLHEGQTHGNSTNNFLVLGFVSIVLEFRDEFHDLFLVLGRERVVSTSCTSADQDHTDCDTSGLSSDSGICVEQFLEFIDNRQFTRPHGCQSHPKSGSMTDNFICMGRPQMRSKKIGCFFALFGIGSRVRAMDQSEGIQRSTFGISTSWRDRNPNTFSVIPCWIFREVWLQKMHRFRNMSSMNYTQRRRGGKLSPVGCFLHPVQVVPQKGIIGSTSI
mmetsp:Transcript_67182/g.188058  ORF Transcript_67182/g.188058 Transcript_67182/m.188058 type:complete len:307 (+) Transcript_67182:1076-1996(+)